MSNENRRKLLKSIAAGSGAIFAGKNLPESWSRPVVDSVLLPSHAQTSGMTYAGSNDLTMNGQVSLVARVLDSVIKPSFAPPCTTLLAISYCITANADNTQAAVQLIMTVDDHCQSLRESALSSFSVPLDGTPVQIPTPVEWGCPGEPHSKPSTTPTIAVNKPSNGVITGVTKWEGESQTDEFTLATGSCEPHQKVCVD